MRPSRLACPLAVTLTLLAGLAGARGDDLDQSEPKRLAMQASVDVLVDNNAPVSKACNDKLGEWKQTMSAIRYDMVHHDSDLPNARDVLAMNYSDAASLCGADAVRYCTAHGAAKHCAALAPALDTAHVVPGQGLSPSG